jgi:hypothetical protein
MKAPYQETQESMPGVLALNSSSQCPRKFSVFWLGFDFAFSIPKDYSVLTPCLCASVVK